VLFHPFEFSISATMELSFSTAQTESCLTFVPSLFQAPDKRATGDMLAPPMASSLSRTRLSFCGIGRFEN